LNDEQVPAAQIPLSVFDPNPPAALIRSVFSENEPAARPEPHSVTITEALQLAQTPLFELSTTSAVSGTSAITSTSVVTHTTPPFLNSIMAGPSPDATGSRRDIYQAENVFDQALHDGFAIRFSYTLTAANGSTQTVNLYEWPAKTLGAYLRASAEWNRSEAATLEIGGKQINGWRVIDRRSATEWLLFELNGTLIAAQPSSVELLNALTHLQPVTR
jgi:phage-related tail fiber protein